MGRAKKKEIEVEIEYVELEPVLSSSSKRGQLWQIASERLMNMMAKGNNGAPSFKTPMDLWQRSCEYFDYIDENPLWVEKPMTEDGIIVNHTYYKPRPYTMEGLAVYLCISRSWFRTFKHSHKNTEDPRKLMFLAVITEIEQIVFTQQYEGATADIFNSNLVARYLGLVEKQEIDAHIDDDTQKPSPLEEFSNAKLKQIRALIQNK